MDLAQDDMDLAQDDMDLAQDDMDLAQDDMDLAQDVTIIFFYCIFLGTVVPEIHFYNMNTGGNSLIIGEKYRLIRPLGKGGMSRVFLAEDLRLHMKWAVKVISCSEEYLLGSFMAEANVLRSVRQENLVRITDIFRWEGNVCIVMDYIEGVKLSDLIKKKPEIVRRNAFDFTISLMHALEAFHERQNPIIYRDMKPDNIMVRPDLTVCLIDFGTAMLFGKREKERSLGTRNYAAPEQMRGHSDVRSDIYSLGKTMEKMDPGSKDGAMRAVIRKALETDPEKRYRTVREMERDLKLRKGRMKRLVITVITGICVIVVISALNFGIRAKQEKALTADLYRRTVESGNEALHNKDFRAGEEYYTKAILEINGYEEEAYRKLLNLYRKEKLTEEGLDRMDSFIDSGYGNTDKMTRLLYECGLAAFEDIKDYNRAKKYFSLSDIKTIPEITYLLNISEYLSSLEKNPDSIIECVKKLRDHTENVKDPLKQAEDRLICMNVCMTLSEETAEEKEALASALLKEGYIQGRRYMEAVKDREEDRDAEKQALNMMSAICRLLGEKFPDKKQEYFSEAINYLDLMEDTEPGEDSAGKYLSIARLYKGIGDCVNACRFYEMAEKEGEGAGIYTEHMKYLESLKNYRELMKVYEMSLSVNGIQETGEYRKLIKSMERKGLLKG